MKKKIMQKKIDELQKKLSPQNLGMRNDIVYRLKMRGYTISAFAKKIGVTPQCVTNALRSSYPRIEREICKVIGDRPKDVWPERYLRRRPRKNKNITAAKKSKTCLNQGAVDERS